MRARPLLLNATTTTDICTLSLHDALPICGTRRATRTAGPDPGSRGIRQPDTGREAAAGARGSGDYQAPRSEEHTSELQSLAYLVCRLLLEKKNRPYFAQVPCGGAAPMTTG